MSSAQQLGIAIHFHHNILPTYKVLTSDLLYFWDTVWSEKQYL